MQENQKKMEECFQEMAIKTNEQLKGLKQDLEVSNLGELRYTWFNGGTIKFRTKIEKTSFKFLNFCPLFY
jgi:hypothetical protein